MERAAAAERQAAAEARVAIAIKTAAQRRAAAEARIADAIKTEAERKAAAEAHAEFLLNAKRVAAEAHTAAYAIAAPAIAHALQRMQLQVPCFSAQRATWPPNTVLNDVSCFLI